VDTDKIIEERTSKKISDIFSQDGEDRFRDLETQVIRDLMNGGEHLVISTGGGSAIRQENRDLFSRKATVVWLTARPDVILSRSQRRPQQRPLLRGDDPLSTIQRLMKERESLYQSVAAFSVDTSDISVAGAVLKIRETVFGSGPG
jgi:shikimate kinase